MPSAPSTEHNINESLRVIHLEYPLCLNSAHSSDLISNTISFRTLSLSPMTNLDSILKSRDITLPTKVCLVKAMVFPVVMPGCESWTSRKLSTEELMLLNYGVRKDS